MPLKAAVMNRRSEMYVQDDGDVPAGGSDLPAGGFSMESPENSGRRTDFSLFDTSVFGLPQNGLSLGVLDDEEGDDSPLESLEEFGEAEEGHFPQPGRRRREKAVARVSAEDFEEGAERNAFMLVEAKADQLFGKRITPQGALDAIRFFFTVEDNGQEITFNLCCDVLQARPSVLRLRMQYEWWLRGTVFTGPFPFSTVPLPQMIAGAVHMYGSDVGYAIARETWIQPGISKEELFQYLLHPDSPGVTSYKASELQHALEALEARYLMSSHGPHLYVTGQNPLLWNARANDLAEGRTTVGGTYHWSRLFGGAE